MSKKREVGKGEKKLMEQVRQGSDAEGGRQEGSEENFPRRGSGKGPGKIRDSNARDEMGGGGWGWGVAGGGGGGGGLGEVGGFFGGRQLKEGG